MSNSDYSSVTPEQFVELHLFTRSKINKWRQDNGLEKFDYRKIKSLPSPPLEKLVDSQSMRDFAPARCNYIYLMYNDSIRSLKVGMTRRKDIRIEQLKDQNWFPIDIIQVDPYGPWNFERIILETAKLNGAVMGDKAYSDQFDGWTECWPMDLYPVTTLSEIWHNFLERTQRMFAYKDLEFMDEQRGEHGSVERIC